MYLLDANVLISAAERNYPPDVVPGFWDQLLEAVASGEVKIPNVADEFGVTCVLPMEMFRSLRRTL